MNLIDDRIIARNYGLYIALARAKNGQEYVGIDSRQLSLVSFHKIGTGFLVSVEYEVEMEGGSYPNSHKVTVDSVEEAVMFFDQFGIGEISWVNKEKLAA